MAEIIIRKVFKKTNNINNSILKKKIQLVHTSFDTAALNFKNS